MKRIFGLLTFFAFALIGLLLARSIVKGVAASLSPVDQNDQLAAFAALLGVLGFVIWVLTMWIGSKIIRRYLWKEPEHDPEE